MKKKIIVAFILMFAVFSLTACKNEDEIKGTVTESKSEFSFGTTANNVYENEFIGIGCELDSNWNFYSQEEILELCNITAETLKDSDALAEALEDTSVIYDMLATNNTNMDNVNITLENKGLIGSLVDMDTYVAASVANIKSAFSTAGYENIEAEGGTFEFLGEEQASIKVKGEIAGTPFYEKLVCFDRDNYIVVITAFSYSEENIDNIFSNFYKLSK